MLGIPLLRFLPLIGLGLAASYFIYLYQHTQSLEYENKAYQIEAQLTKVQMDEMASRSKAAQDAIVVLTTELTKKQQADSARVKRLLSQRTPTDCKGSLEYLRTEAANIDWK